MSPYSLSILNERDERFGAQCFGAAGNDLRHANHLAATFDRVDAAHDVFGRVVESVKEPIDVDALLGLDLVREHVDGVDVYVLERVDQACVQDHVADVGISSNTRVRVENVDRGTSSAVVNAVLFQHGVESPVARVQRDRRGIRGDCVFDHRAGELHDPRFPIEVGARLLERPEGLVRVDDDPGLREDLEGRLRDPGHTGCRQWSVE
jgi:hypothetical protein